MNKKASEKTIWLVVMAIVIFSVAFLLLSFFQKGTESTKKVMGSYIEALTEDFDNDDIKDFYDKSPCVAGEDMVVVEEGINYYFFADLKDLTGCTGFKEAAEFYKERGVDDFKLEKKHDTNTGLDVCVLPDKICGRALKATYEQIRKDSKN